MCDCVEAHLSVDVGVLLEVITILWKLILLLFVPGASPSFANIADQLTCELSARAPMAGSPSCWVAVWDYTYAWPPLVVASCALGLTLGQRACEVGAFAY